MYEPLETLKFEKYDKIIAEPKELVRILNYLAIKTLSLQLYMFVSF